MSTQPSLPGPCPRIWAEAPATHRKHWWAREDSNLQPDRYERSALTIELRARGAQVRRGIDVARSPNTTAGVARQLRAAAASRRRIGATGGTGAGHCR